MRLVAVKLVVTTIVQAASSIASIFRNDMADYGLIHVFIGILLVIPAAITAVFAMYNSKSPKFLTPLLVALPLFFIGNIIGLVHDVNSLASDSYVCSSAQVYACMTIISAISTAVGFYVAVIAALVTLWARKYLKAMQRWREENVKLSTERTVTKPEVRNQKLDTLV